MKQRIFLILFLFCVLIGAAVFLNSAMAKPLPEGAIADGVIIEKTLHRLTLTKGKETLKVYTVSLGRGGKGAKEREGDNKVPEGKYHISGRNQNSQFYKSLRISYPEPRDVEAARKRGSKPGGNIMIHGLRNGFGWLGSFHLLMDWTAGCIAVTDSEMDEIWRVVSDGTPVEIKP